MSPECAAQPGCKALACVLSDQQFGVQTEQPAREISRGKSADESCGVESILVKRPRGDDADATRQFVRASNRGHYLLAGCTGELTSCERGRDRCDARMHQRFIVRVIKLETMCH